MIFCACRLHDDSSVRTYLDCGWLSTDILKRNSLDTPDDADIVIGYLFMVSIQNYTHKRDVWRIEGFSLTYQ